MAGLAAADRPPKFEAEKKERAPWPTWRCFVSIVFFCAFLMGIKMNNIYIYIYSCFPQNF